MLAQTLWWADNALIAFLFVCAIRGRFLTKYAIFYSYLCGVLLLGSVRFYVIRFEPSSYLEIYWYTQFLLVAGGFSIIWQIYAHTLDPYPGTARMARVLVGTVFVTILTQQLFTMFTGHSEESIRSVIRLDRNLQSIQAVLIMVLIMLVWYYGIPLGRNTKGLLLGHGLLIATRLITLTAQSFFEISNAWWYHLEQTIGFATLMVWAIAFRTYEPNPVPGREAALEQDYELIARRTAQALSRARGHLVRALLQ